jgi:hypothetical protein
MKLSDWINSVLTAAIGVAAFLQWRVASKLERIESTRENVRLLLRFARSDYGVGIRIANLSGFGVFIERIECAIAAALPADVPPLDNGENEFRSTATWDLHNVLPAFSTNLLDIQMKIIETIGQRNAEFICNLQAKAVYIDNHGQEQTTPAERIRAKVHQQRFMGYIAE